MRGLNLYSGLGGNRKLWKNISVTAVEIDEEVAAIYQKHFPQDKVIIADAHQYLLDHYKEFDFIWSSRPCKTHSRSRMWASKGGKYPPVYPDLGLYEEIYFLQNFYGGRWVVENVHPYYKPLLAPDFIIDRHLIWCNFYIHQFMIKEDGRDHNHIGQKIYGFDLSNEKIKNRKDQIIRNCVDPELGLHIFKCSLQSLPKAM